MSFMVNPPSGELNETQKAAKALSDALLKPGAIPPVYFDHDFAVVVRDRKTGQSAVSIYEWEEDDAGAPVRWVEAFQNAIKNLTEGKK